METTISVPEEMLHQVDEAARRLGVSRSDFFAQAAERWLKALDHGTTATINGVLGGLPADHAFTDAAASALVQADRDWRVTRRAGASPRHASASEFRRGGKHFPSR